MTSWVWLQTSLLGQGVPCPLLGHPPPAADPQGGGGGEWELGTRKPSSPHVSSEIKTVTACRLLRVKPHSQHPGPEDEVASRGRLLSVFRGSLPTGRLTFPHAHPTPDSLPKEATPSPGGVSGTGQLSASGQKAPV